MCKARQLTFENVVSATKLKLVLETIMVNNLIQSAQSTPHHQPGAFHLLTGHHPQDTFNFTTTKQPLLTGLIPKITPPTKFQPITLTKLARFITYHPTTSILLKGSQTKPQSNQYITLLQRSRRYCCCYHFHNS